MVFKLTAADLMQLGSLPSPGSQDQGPRVPGSQGHLAPALHVGHGLPRPPPSRPGAEHRATEHQSGRWTLHGPEMFDTSVAMKKMTPRGTGAFRTGSP